MTPVPGAPAGHLLETDGVSIEFGGLAALKGVAIGVPAGSIFGVVGPNGSGKTTLVNVLSGIYDPSAGEVRFDGERIDGLYPEAIAAKGLVRTFQQAAVFPECSVRENLELGGYLRGRRRGPREPRPGRRWRPRRRVREDDWTERLLERLGLEGRGDTVARELGLGEQKHLGIGIALAADPKMVMLDEPAAGMSMADVDALMRLIERLRAEGRTILVIEHNMDLIMGICDRVAVLDFGSLIAEGTPAEVAADERVTTAYLGRRKVHAPKG